MTNRRLPPPWTAERLPGGFKMIDAKGSHSPISMRTTTITTRTTAGVLTMDEARRLASNSPNCQSC